MILLHTSDWHLGAWEGELSLREDQEHFIGQIVEIVKEKHADAVLIAGDVFDRAVASAEAIGLYDKAMTALCKECGVSVYIIAGNHDGAERLQSCSGLLEKAGLYICGELKADADPLPLGEDAELFLLPWITAEKVRSVYPAEKENVTDVPSACAVAAEHLRAKFTPGKKHVLLAHAFISAAELSDSDRSAVVGLATQVSASTFEGFDYVALGHLHGHQEPVKGRIVYSGTPMAYSFGREETQTKGVVLLDTDAMAQEFVPLKPLHKRTTIPGTLEEILNGEVDEETRNGYVRLQVSDQYVGISALQQLETKFPQLIEVSCPLFAGEEGKVTLRPEELRGFENTPSEVFRKFCSDVMGCEADEELLAMFERAVETAEKEGR